MQQSEDITVIPLPAAEMPTAERLEPAYEPEAAPVKRRPHRFPVRLLSAGVSISVLLGVAIWLSTAMPIFSLVAAWLFSPLIILALGALFGERLNR